MTKMRRLSVFLILLSAAISILIGVSLYQKSEAGAINYRAIYYGSRCLLQHADPYNPNEFLRVYRADGGLFPTEPSKLQWFLRAVPICVNLPTTLFLITPLALLPWGLALSFWWILLAASLIAAAFLSWDLSADYAPGVSLFLICILLANSQVLFTTGNTAGMAVGLCVIAAWCFLKRRLAVIGVLCLALSLAIKPHDSALAWLYFLLAGGALRKRALQALAVMVLLCLPALLWTSSVAPGWARELHANIVETSSHGDISDPGPASIARKGTADVIIDLQSVISVFRDDPRIYNPLTYAICGSMFLMWGIAIFRSRLSTTTSLYALAVIAPLSMLATYHRPYDAKLLLLSVPACCILWAEGGAIGRWAFALTAAAVTLTGDIPLAMLAMITRNLDESSMGGPGRTLTIAFFRPAPLALLAMTVFYLWVFLRSASRPTPVSHPTISEHASAAPSSP